MKIIIIGNGPAGVSTALYACRNGVSTTIVGRDSGALTKADKIENYYGFAEPISGSELVKNGLEGAVRLGAEYICDEVLSISFESDFEVVTKGGAFHADRVLLATGAQRSAPKIKGLSEHEGSGVSYCAICDGFFFRGKPVCVLGNGDYAVHEAEILSKIASDVTIVTNGASAPTLPEGIKVDTRKIIEIAGDGRVEKIIFEDGELLSSALFIAVGVAGSTAFAVKLGALTNGNKIVVNEKMETNVPGLFAAGDCTGGVYQIAKAVHEGMIAGIAMGKKE